MNVTAVAVDDLKGKGLENLRDEFCLMGVYIGKKNNKNTTMSTRIHMAFPQEGTMQKQENMNHFLKKIMKMATQNVLMNIGKNVICMKSAK